MERLPLKRERKRSASQCEIAKIYLNKTSGAILSKGSNDEIFSLIKKFSKGSYPGKGGSSSQT